MISVMSNMFMIFPKSSFLNPQGSLRLIYPLWNMLLELLKKSSFCLQMEGTNIILSTLLVIGFRFL